jgi:hypothetical protein
MRVIAFISWMTSTTSATGVAVSDDNDVVVVLAVVVLATVVGIGIIHATFEIQWQHTIHDFLDT